MKILRRCGATGWPSSVNARVLHLVQQHDRRAADHEASAISNARVCRRKVPSCGCPCPSARRSIGWRTRWLGHRWPASLLSSDAQCVVKNSRTGNPKKRGVLGNQGDGFSRDCTEIDRAGASLIKTRRPLACRVGKQLDVVDERRLSDPSARRCSHLPMCRSIRRKAWLLVAPWRGE